MAFQSSSRVKSGLTGNPRFRIYVYAWVCGDVQVIGANMSL